jgi:hypothetical protein
MMQNRYVYKQCRFDVVFLIYGQRNTHFGEKIFLDLTMQSIFDELCAHGCHNFENWCRPAVSGPLALNRWPAQGLEPKQEGHKRCP